MSKLEKFIQLLREILFEADKEKNSPRSIWRVSLLDNIVVPEISELLKYAQGGEIYFKNGKKQSMLQSSYYITDEMAPLDKTSLGRKILELQQLYRKL